MIWKNKLWWKEEAFTPKGEEQRYTLGSIITLTVIIMVSTLGG